MDETHIDLAHAMVLVDSICAVATFYIAIFISRTYGGGGLADKLKWIHRLTVLAISVGFAWHAKDVASSPMDHGLATSNFFLHSAFAVGLSVAALRFRISLEPRRAVGRKKKYENGDPVVGPFAEH